MAGKQPILKLESFPLRLAVWENEGKEGRKWHSAKLTKAYKNSEGKWLETSSLGDRDWLPAAALLQGAWDILGIGDVTKGRPPKEETSEQDTPF